MNLGEFNGLCRRHGRGSCSECLDARDDRVTTSLAQKRMLVTLLRYGPQRYKSHRTVEALAGRGCVGITSDGSVALLDRGRVEAQRLMDEGDPQVVAWGGA